MEVDVTTTSTRPKRLNETRTIDHRADHRCSIFFPNSKIQFVNDVGLMNTVPVVDDSD